MPKGDTEPKRPEGLIQESGSLPEGSESNNTPAYVSRLSEKIRDTLGGESQPPEANYEEDRESLEALDVLTGEAIVGENPSSPDDGEPIPPKRVGPDGQELPKPEPPVRRAASDEDTLEV
jgi:hypothetical protein